MSKKYFFFDCETGGINSNTSLLSLYGVVLDEKLQPAGSIDLKIKPDNGCYSLFPRAMEINNINIIEHDKEAILESEAAKIFYDFAFKHGGSSKMIAAGHNLSLDIRFVKHKLLRDDTQPDGHSWGRFFSHRRLDTASIAQYLCLAGKLPQDLDCSLKSLAKHFNLSYEGAHESKFDTELTLEVLKKFIELDGSASLY